METSTTTLTTAASNGSLSALGQSLANVGTAAKALALAHPMGMAVAGGALLGMGTYYALGKVFSKKTVVEPVAVAA